MKTAIIASLALPALAEDAAPAAAAEEEFSVPDTTGAAFVETFQTDPFETGRWTKSADTTYDGQEWTFGAPDGVEGKYKDDTVSSRFLRCVEGSRPARSRLPFLSPLPTFPRPCFAGAEDALVILSAFNAVSTRTTHTHKKKPHNNTHNTPYAKSLLISALDGAIMNILASTAAFFAAVGCAFIMCLFECGLHLWSSKAGFP